MTDTVLSDLIFRAYDIRGVVPDTLNPSTALLIGRAIGAEAHQRNQKHVCVAYDGRLSSPELANALTDGLLASGIDVIQLGQLPTPGLYFSACELTQGSGIMVTGSHNPVEYNGFKIMLGGHTLSDDEITDLHRRINEADFSTGDGQLIQQDMSDPYIERLQQDIPPLAGISVAVDCGNGVAGPWITRLLTQLGCHTIPLYCEIDGRFPNHHPDPEKPENLQDLIHAVKGHSADIGLALDGDGDRLVAVDESGNIITPDQLICLFTESLLSGNPGATIVHDVKTSLRVTELINNCGGSADMWKCGHSMIKNRMRANGALFGGEFSGHLFFADRWYGFDDGLYAAVRLLELLKQTGKKASEIFSQYPPLPSSPMINIAIADSDKFSFIQQLSLLDFGAAEQCTVDGLRVTYNDGWFGIRASNTTPILTLRIEALSQKALRRLTRLIDQKLKLVDPDLQIPELAVTNDTNTINRED